MIQARMQWADVPGGVQDVVEETVARVAAARMIQVPQVRGRTRLTNDPKPVFTDFDFIHDEVTGTCAHTMMVPVYRDGRKQTLVLTLGVIPYMRAWAQSSAFTPVVGHLEEVGFTPREIDQLIPQIFHCTFGSCLFLEVEVNGEIYIPMGVRGTMTAGGFSSAKWCMPPGGYCEPDQSPFDAAREEFTQELRGDLGGNAIEIHPVAGVALFADKPNTSFAVLGSVRADRMPTFEGGWEWSHDRKIAMIPRQAVFADFHGDNRLLLEAFQEYGVSPDPDLHVANDVRDSAITLYHGLGLYKP